MIASAYSVAFDGLEARLVEVQCALSPGLPSFSMVGLPDKAVSEAKERVRSALQAFGIALPAKKITLNLAPADLPKEGAHFDLPIALALLAAVDILPKDEIAATLAMGELSLDGRLLPVLGTLPAALAAAEHDLTLLCPHSSAAEAAWVGAAEVLGAKSLDQILRHFTGQTPLPPADAVTLPPAAIAHDLRAVKGLPRAKRALEIAAAGRHHMLMMGPPGTGKSFLAKCMPGILPPLSVSEALETSMIHSLAGLLPREGISRNRPYFEPHHSASMVALVGGGRKAQPGQISFAHNGVLFLDELPEFSRPALESLRQPIETGSVMIARANAHVRYPSRFLLLAAANPCRCGHLLDADRACNRAPICGQDYLGKISGPLLDRFDLRIDFAPPRFTDTDLRADGESSRSVAARVAAARARQTARYGEDSKIRTNADLEGAILDEHASPDAESRNFINKFADKMGLSARGYYRILKVARTIADLAGDGQIGLPHVTEAISYRLDVKFD